MIFWKKATLPTFFLLSLSLQAQYPSSDIALPFQPLLAEVGEQRGFPNNPASLAKRAGAPLGVRNQLETFSIDTNVSLISLLLDLDSLKESFLQNFNFQKYAALLAKGTSFDGPGIDNFGTLEYRASEHYQNRITQDVMPSLTQDLLNTPIGFSQEKLDKNADFQKFVEDTDNDLDRARANLAEGADNFIQEALEMLDFLSFSFSFDALRLSFISEGFGFRGLVSVQGFLRPYLQEDFSLVDNYLPELSIADIDQSNMPSDSEFITQPQQSINRVEDELHRVAGATINDLTAQMTSTDFLSDIVYAMLAQGKVRGFVTAEIEAKLGYGFNLIPNFWDLGIFLNNHLFIGQDNYTVKRGEVGAQPLGYFSKLSNQVLGFHTGIDLGSSLHLTRWLSWSLLVSDIVGLAHSPLNAHKASFGDLYYPIDLDSGLGAAFSLGGIRQLHLGIDAYDIIDIFLKRQRFDRQLETIDHFRFLVMLEWIQTFAIALQYYDRGFTVAAELSFMHYRPHVSFTFSPVTGEIKIGLNLVSFSWI